MSPLSRLARVAVPVIAFTVTATANTDTKQIKSDTMNGSDAQIQEVAQEVTKEGGFDVKIIELSDYIQPNPALDSGDLDADGLQHQPSLDSQIQTHHHKIINVDLTYVAPTGFRSEKVKSLAQLREGAKVGVQNDSSNGNHTLLLLQKAGMIKLKADADADGNNTAPRDMVENLKRIKLIELDSARLPRSLDDPSVVSINTDYAVKNGLTPTEDTITLEDHQGPYVNLITVHEKDKDRPWTEALVRACRSENIRRFTDTQFKSAIPPAF